MVKSTKIKEKVKISVKRAGKVLQQVPSRIGRSMERAGLKVALPRSKPPSSMSSAPTMASVDSDVMAGAMTYVGAQSDATNPAFAGARVPDILDVPTGTIGLQEEFALTTSTTQSTQFAFSAQVTATGAGAFATRVAVAGSYPAWPAGVASANMSVLQSACLTYRTVGFCVKLFPTTAAQNRQGLIRASRRGGVVADYPAAASALSLDPGMKEYAGADANLPNYVFNWMPDDYDQALEFVSPYADQTDGPIVFELPATAVAQTYIARTYHMCELVPTIQQSALIPTASVTGSASDYARAVAWAKRAAGVADRVLPGDSGSIAKAILTRGKSLLIGAGKAAASAAFGFARNALFGAGALRRVKHVTSYHTYSYLYIRGEVGWTRRPIDPAVWSPKDASWDLETAPLHPMGVLTVEEVTGVVPSGGDDDEVVDAPASPPPSDDGFVGVPAEKVGEAPAPRARSRAPTAVGFARPA